MGDSFHVAFAQIGDLRSVLPQRVHVLALIATTTKDPFKTVKKKLSLENPLKVGVPPDRDTVWSHMARSTFYVTCSLPDCHFSVCIFQKF